jgi:apurinic endonuclease APN1
MIYKKDHVMKTAQHIGAHLGKDGSFLNPLRSIGEKGGNCLQIFSSSPMVWASATASRKEISEFRQLKSELQIDPVYFHASYLINLADDSVGGQRSRQSLQSELNLAQSLGIRGSIIHLGSFKNKGKSIKTTVQPTIFDQKELPGNTIPENIPQDEKFPKLIGNITEVLASTPNDTLFIIENAGNRKIGQTLDEIGAIIHTTNVQTNNKYDARLKVCLDTCHLHAAGYDLTTMDKLDAFLTDFDRLIGLNHLELFHANDSKDLFGSLRDRHENLGEGQVGLSVFRNLLTHNATKNLPLIIETPGFDNRGPDKQNMDILKNIINE